MTAQDRVRVARTAAGTIEIGAAPAAGHDHVVAVFGGLVSVDLAEPAATPTASLDDVVQAAWWLSLVYGDEVAAAVAELGSVLVDPEDDLADDWEGGADVPDIVPEERDVELAPGPLADCLARYARLDWLHWAWPSSDGAPFVRADETAFDVELGVLAARLEFVLGGPHVAAGLLSPRVDEVLTELVDGSPDLALLRPALRAIAETVPLADALHDRVRAEEDRADEVIRSTRALSDDALAEFLEERSRSDSFLPLVDSAQVIWRAGGRPRGRGRGRGVGRTVAFGVNRYQVPRRSLSAADDAGELTIVPGRSSTGLEIVVRGGDRPTDRALSALVYVDADDMPAAVIPLRRSRSGLYSGSGELGRAGDEFYVEVVDPALMGRPDPGARLRIEDATLALLERALGEARGLLDATPVDQLSPTAPVRALVPGALRHG